MHAEELLAILVLKHPFMPALSSWKHLVHVHITYRMRLGPASLSCIPRGEADFCTIQGRLSLQFINDKHFAALCYSLQALLKMRLCLNAFISDTLASSFHFVLEPTSPLTCKTMANTAVRSSLACCTSADDPHQLPFSRHHPSRAWLCCAHRC